MPMKNPPHPGLSVRHDCLEPPGAQRDGGSAQARRQPANSFRISCTAVRVSRPRWRSVSKSTGCCRRRDSVMKVLIKSGPCVNMATVQ